MNLEYVINESTGRIDLKFKQSTLDYFDTRQKYIFENHIIKMLCSNNKFALTGSLSLILLGFENWSRINDFDFILLENLTEQEHSDFINIFKLTEYPNPDSSKNLRYEDSKIKVIFDKNSSQYCFLYDTHDEKIDSKISILLDVFNEYVIQTPSESIKIYYRNHLINLCSPRISIVTRLKYALDVRSKPFNKHLTKIKDFLNSEERISDYKKLQIKIYKMDWRCREYNKILDEDQNKKLEVLELISKQKTINQNFINNIFDRILDDRIKQYTDTSNEQLIAAGDIFG